MSGHRLLARFEPLISPSGGIPCRRWHDATTDRIEVASSADLDSLPSYTLMSWLRLDAASNGFLWRKGADAPARHSWQFTPVPRVLAQRDRAAINAVCIADLSAFAPFAFGRWLFLATQFDGAGGTITHWLGTLDLPAQEPSSYVTQNAGAGTPGANSGEVAWLGNRTGTSESFPGPIAMLAVTDLVLRPDEMIEWQYHPTVFSGLRGLWVPGLDSGDHITDRSGRGNHGVATGLDRADDLPMVRFRRWWVAGADLGGTVTGDGRTAAAPRPAR